MSTLIQRRPLCSDSQVSDNPLLNRIYQARGITSPNQLDLSLKSMLNPTQLANIDDAVAILFNSFQQQDRIIIVGDFDADGATSTALAVLALRQFGFKHVDYLIPDRFSQGYGLSIAVVEMILMKGADLVITVDNGISSLDGIDLLKAHHIKVLVTDHHLPMETLPKADAIINPNLPNCHFPSKCLAGVGVIFYLMVSLRTKFRTEKVFKQQEPNIAALLDLVALGTIADVVPLDQNNRILVAQGVNRIRMGRCREGIKALADIAKRELSNLQESDLGFAIAPRLNAAGRLENMALGVELLLCDDPQHARQLALELDSLNQTRKTFEQEMRAEALAICAKLPHLTNHHQPQGIVLYQADWHQGVLGILASRIKDQFHRPVVAFAQEDTLGHFLRGSARSIPSIHIRDVFEQIDRNHPELIVKFGGHAMAAGLTIASQHLDQFKAVFDQTLQEQVQPDQWQNITYTDGELTHDEFTLDTAYLLKKSGPWGHHFPEPVFEGTFRILQQKIVAQTHLKLIVEHESGILLDAIWFNADLRQYPDHSIQCARLVYRLEVNQFRTPYTLQLILENLSTELANKN